jgi:hypothetical protein
MPMILLCTGCGTKLKIPDEFKRKQARCPKCGELVTLPEPADADDEVEQEPRGARRAAPAPPEPRRAARAAEDQDARRPRRSVAQENDDDRPRRRRSADEEHEEEAAPERPRVKRRRKRRPAAESEGMPQWVWLWAALVGYVFVLVLVGVALSAAGHGFLVAVYGIALAILVPASLLILILSMFISSAIAGGIDFGEVHIVIPKALLLLLIVDTVAAFPVESRVASLLLSAATLVIWLVGLMYFFNLDFSEARILVGVNWVLNFLVHWLIFMAILSVIMRGGPALPGGGDLFREQPATQEEKDLDRIDELGGDFDFDENQPNDPVIKITFAGSRVSDADLAMLKRFPRLRTLDLSRTQITDAGLQHLKGLQQLEQVTLTGTRVTDAGAQGLRQALPRTKITR